MTLPPYMTRCRACGCAASRVKRKGHACEECCWCGAVHFADGKRANRSVVAVDPPRGLAADVAGDVTRSPW